MVISMDIDSVEDLSCACILIEIIVFSSISSWIGFTWNGKLYEVHVKEAKGMYSEPHLVSLKLY